MAQILADTYVRVKECGYLAVLAANIATFILSQSTNAVYNIYRVSEEILIRALDRLAIVASHRIASHRECTLL